MVDTPRTTAALLTAFADNTSGLITAQNARDLIVSQQSNMFNVMQYGAKGDGSTDDTASINSAIAAAVATSNGAVVFFPPRNYNISGSGIQITANKRISLVGYGAQLQASANSTSIITVSQGNAGQEACHLSGFIIMGFGFTPVTGITFSNTILASYRDINIVACTTGILYTNVVASTFVESVYGSECAFFNCTTGMSFIVNGGNQSFNQCSLTNISFSSCTTGINVGLNANMLRTNFRNITIWVDANQTGLAIGNCTIDAATWDINFEGVSLTASVGASFNSTLQGTSSKADLRFTQVAGSLATPWQNPGNAVIRFREGDNMYECTSSGTIVATGPVVCNSATATSLGTLSKKMQVFDASGTSLGFVPIYTTIT